MLAPNFSPSLPFRTALHGGATIARVALAGALLLLALDWRSPFLASVRLYAFAVLIGAALVLVIAELVFLRRWRARPRLLAGLSVLSLLLSSVAATSVAAFEVRYQWMRRAVLEASPAALREVGGRVMVGYRDIATMRLLARQPAVAGVFISGRNVLSRDAGAIRREIDELQDIRRGQQLPPLLVATDQEGGIVSRLSPPLPRRPPLASVIAGASDIDARRTAVRGYAAAQGKELAALGVTLNFAPVVDLKHGVVNPRDRLTRINERAISADPAVVSDVASTYCGELRAHGVHCTLKHFPGMGRVFDDTHVQSAELATEPEELERSDWVPFRTLMAQGEPVVMLGHVQLTRLDPDRPASLSRTVVDGLLRKNWKYDGVLVTDDFSMAAVTGAKGGIGQAAVDALNAGADLVLVVYDPDQYFPVMYALLEASRSALLDPERRTESERRLEKLRVSPLNAAMN